MSSWAFSGRTSLLSADVSMTVDESEGSGKLDVGMFLSKGFSGGSIGSLAKGR